MPKPARQAPASAEAMMGLMRATPPTKPGDYPEDDPQGAMQLAFEQLRSEFPAETAGASMRPMRGYEKWIKPGAKAITLPTGSIAYNPDWVAREQSTNADTLAHELTHVRQFQQMPALRRLMYVWLPPKSERVPYYQRPMEKEAFRTEEVRRGKRRDIMLPEAP